MPDPSMRIIQPSVPTMPVVPDDDVVATVDGGDAGRHGVAGVGTVGVRRGPPQGVVGVERGDPRVVVDASGDGGLTTDRVRPVGLDGETRDDGR